MVKISQPTLQPGAFAVTAKGGFKATEINKKADLILDTAARESCCVTPQQIQLFSNREHEFQLAVAAEITAKVENSVFQGSAGCEQVDKQR